MSASRILCHRCWRDYAVVICAAFVLLLHNIQNPAEALIIRENSVRLRVLEYSSKDGSLLKVLNSRYSDLVVGEEVGENSQVVLECSTEQSGPLLWKVTGDGDPQYKSHYTSAASTGSTLSYSAFISFPNGLSSSDTGQYSCLNAYNASVNNYVYLFVPKRKDDGKLPIFIPSRRKHEVVIPSGERSARIPCSVVHPNVNVSLERVSPRKSFWLERPMRVPYSPKTGFTVPVAPTMREKFICRGEYNGSFEEVTYLTSPQQPRIDAEAEMIPNFPTRNRPNSNANEVAAPGLSQPEVGPGTHLRSVCTPQTCGVNAECVVREYKAYCVCLENYSGDPYTQCTRLSHISQNLRREDPCSPSPCGEYSECIEVNGHALCTCQPGYFGSPPNCQSQKVMNCSKNYDCEWTEFCNSKTSKCEDICYGSVKFCANNALCTAFSHMPYCSCDNNMIGDPYDAKGIGCQPQYERLPTDGAPSCNPNPCGVNAHCRVVNSYPLPICFCPSSFTGDPSHKCYKIVRPVAVEVFRPDSISPNPPTPFDHFGSRNTLCTKTSCGENARCRYRSNRIECVCKQGFKGDPYKFCHRITIAAEQLKDICSVCGRNSICSLVANDVRCKCAPNTQGVPPQCQRINTTPDPNALSHQLKVPSSPLPLPYVVSNACLSDIDCPLDKSCYSTVNKCLNPCTWACSESPGVECQVINHQPQCKCAIGYRAISRNAQFECTKIPESESDQQRTIHKDHPSTLDPRPHTKCRGVSVSEYNHLRRNAFSARALEMEKNPFQRALLHYIHRVNRVTQGGDDQSSSNDSTGFFSECTCLPGFTGNPYSIEGCSQILSDSSSIGGSGDLYSDPPHSDLEQSPSSSVVVIQPNPCSLRANICGKHSLCVAFKGSAFCRCDFNAVGEPPNCKLRCRTDHHCLFNEVCLNGECVLQHLQHESFHEHEHNDPDFPDQSDNSIRK